jgi:hypothetical protein
MATTALSTLLPLMSVSHCPSPVQLQALRLAFRRFCDDTGVWTEDLTTFDTVADQAAYTLTAGYSNVVIRRVTKVTVDDADQLEDAWSLSPAGVLTFDTAPTVAGLDVVVTVVYSPETDCTLAVDWLVARWGWVIAAGAEAHLKSDPGRANDPNPWADTASAAVAEERYRSGVFEAKMEMYTARQSGHMGVDMRIF